MLQAIRTRELRQTKGSRARLRATSCAPYGPDGGVSVTVPWDHRLRIEDNHAAAAKALAEQLGWDGRYHAAALDERSRCYLRVPMQGAPVVVADFAIWPKAED